MSCQHQDNLLSFNPSKNLKLYNCVHFYNKKRVLTEKKKEEKTALTQDKLDAMQRNIFKRIKCL